MELGCSGALRITKSSCLTADSSFTLEACPSKAQMELDCRGALHIAKSSCLRADSSLEPCSSTVSGVEGSNFSLRASFFGAFPLNHPLLQRYFDA